MSRFDYVKYEPETVDRQQIFKEHVEELERMITTLDCPRSIEKAIEALEVCYMWIGKGLKNTQIKKNYGVFELQEKRKNG